MDIFLPPLQIISVAGDEAVYDLALDAIVWFTLDGTPVGHLWE
jgi:hypothetical protein